MCTVWRVSIFESKQEQSLKRPPRCETRPKRKVSQMKAAQLIFIFTLYTPQKYQNIFDGSYLLLAIQQHLSTGSQSTVVGYFGISQCMRAKMKVR